MERTERSFIKNGKNGTFFYKERKRTERTECSFEKNGFPTLMFSDDIGHISQALFSQVPYYQAFDWDFVVDHQDRHRWYELQWLHMIDSQY